MDMNIQQFNSILFEQKQYITPSDRKVSVLARIPILRGLGFYCQYFWLVFCSSVHASTRYWSDDVWSQKGVAVISLAEKYGLRFHVDGLESVAKQTKPIIFVANHMSTLETQILACIVDPFTRSSYVVKDLLMKIPFFNAIMKATHAIPLGRKNPIQDINILFQTTQERLEKKRSIIIFPQASRKKIFKEKEFSSVGSRLSDKLDYPCIPIVLKTDAWGLGKVIKDIGPINPEKIVRVHFGEPLSKELSAKAQHRQCLQFFRETLSAWDETLVQDSQSV